ncbi:flagellar basal body rod C-terminal domain-containing protein [Parvularcula marina]|jgi:flagellar basal-body rod protein FlgC|uniref:Flagellar basal body rod protein FlgC n=1 Tax=Parvularcula marina TaxID=2292771 RepID=A0A371RH16_9PROT|nr:flagellar basal body rod C-terminal domain-containing protein [Parvularcula marina]RFB04722.1 flagellar basal body rod protein FlgC [Parvularcula marina]
MVDPLNAALKSASNGMEVQSLRLRTVNENISNVDTPGYHRKLLTFGIGSGDTSVEVKRLTLDPAEGKSVLDPGHPLADESGYVTLSNVDLMVEMADAREAKRTFDSNLEAFRQARDMYAGLIGLLRR